MHYGTYQTVWLGGLSCRRAVTIIALLAAGTASGQAVENQPAGVVVSRPATASEAPSLLQSQDADTETGRHGDRSPREYGVHQYDDQEHDGHPYDGHQPGTAPAASRPATNAERLGAEPPALDDLDRADLIRFVRQTVNRQVRQEPRPETSPYTPASLENLECPAAVTLRRNGRLLGTGHSDSLPVMEALERAALAAIENAAGDAALTVADLDILGLEIELIGQREPVGHGGEAAEWLAARFEPALHGIAVRIGGKEVLILPSQLISKEVFCEYNGEMGHRCNRYKIAIENLQEKLGISRVPSDRSPESVAIGRFRTTHFHQSGPGADSVALFAGMRHVRPEEVTLESMRAVSADLARYLRTRQNADGLFSYEYLPGRGIYWVLDQNWVRQAATTWIAARYARLSGNAEMAAVSERAIGALAALVRPAQDNPRGAYVHTPDYLHSLGTAALFALALIDSPEEEKHADMLASLMAGIEGMQMPEGWFRGHFPPSQKTASQDYYPGEALLAIARYYAAHPDAERRALCDRALPFYVQYFRERQAPAFAPWHIQAWGEMARTTRLQKYADFVFELADFLLAMQMDEPTLPLAIYDGGFDTTGEGRSGISTGVYLEGLVEAIRTADAFGDMERAIRYREAALRAARFVMQLRFREEECYYVTVREPVVGGMRNTPIDPTLRIDHVQHALAALMGGAEVLDMQGAGAK